MFTLRIVNVDHYLSLPVADLDPSYSTFRGSPVSRVPVVRIFGATPAGQKCCLHIHGAFPYIIVPYDGSEALGVLPYVLASALDKAINVALGHSESIVQHVFNITPVSGIPFYGFHRQEHIYLKIYLYNPHLVRKASDLLQNGAVLGKCFQPHESHVPYILQFMMDNNLHGMNFVHLNSCKFRQVPDTVGSSLESKDLSIQMSKSSEECHSKGIHASMRVWSHNSVPKDAWLPDSVEKMSTCELEVDSQVCNIMNNQELKNGSASNPGLSYIWEDEKARRAKLQLPTQDLSPPSSPPRTHVESSTSEKKFKNLLREKLLSKNKESSSEASHTHISLPVQTPQNSDLLNATASLRWGSEPKVSPISTQEDMKVVIDETVIQLLSQKESSSVWFDTQDRELMSVMGKLADGSQLENLEDHDALLSSLKPSGSEEAANSDPESDDAQETILMTQPISYPKNIEEAFSGSSTEHPLPQIDGCSDGDARLCLVEKNWCNHIFFEHGVFTEPKLTSEASVKGTTVKKLVFPADEMVSYQYKEKIPQFDGGNDIIEPKSTSRKSRKADSRRNDDSTDRKYKKVPVSNHKHFSDTSPASSHQSHSSHSLPKIENQESRKKHHKEHKSSKPESHSRVDMSSKFLVDHERETSHHHREKHRKHKEKHHRRPESSANIEASRSNQKNRESGHHTSSHSKDEKRSKSKRDSSSRKKKTAFPESVDSVNSGVESKQESPSQSFNPPMYSESFDPFANPPATPGGLWASKPHFSQKPPMIPLRPLIASNALEAFMPPLECPPTPGFHVVMHEEPENNELSFPSPVVEKTSSETEEIEKLFQTKSPSSIEPAPFLERPTTPGREIDEEVFGVIPTMVVYSKKSEKVKSKKEHSYPDFHEAPLERPPTPGRMFLEDRIDDSLMLKPPMPVARPPTPQNPALPKSMRGDVKEIKKCRKSSKQSRIGRVEEAGRHAGASEPMVIPLPKFAQESSLVSKSSCSEPVKTENPRLTVCVPNKISSSALADSKPQSDAKKEAASQPLVKKQLQAKSAAKQKCLPTPKQESRKKTLKKQVKLAHNPVSPHSTSVQFKTNGKSSTTMSSGFPRTPSRNFTNKPEPFNLPNIKALVEKPLNKLISPLPPTPHRDHRDCRPDFSDSSRLMQERKNIERVKHKAQDMVKALEKTASMVKNPVPPPLSPMAPTPRREQKEDLGLHFNLGPELSMMSPIGKTPARGSSTRKSSCEDFHPTLSDVIDRKKGELFVVPPLFSPMQSTPRRTNSVDSGGKPIDILHQRNSENEAAVRSLLSPSSMYPNLRPAMSPLAPTPIRQPEYGFIATPTGTDSYSISAAPLPMNSPLPGTQGATPNTSSVFTSSPLKESSSRCGAQSEFLIPSNQEQPVGEAEHLSQEDDLLKISKDEQDKAIQAICADPDFHASVASPVCDSDLNNSDFLDPLTEEMKEETKNAALLLENALMASEPQRQSIFSPESSPVGPTLDASVVEVSGSNISQSSNSNMTMPVLFPGEISDANSFQPGSPDALQKAVVDLGLGETIDDIESIPIVGDVNTSLSSVVEIPMTSSLGEVHGSTSSRSSCISNSPVSNVSKDISQENQSLQMLGMDLFGEEPLSKTVLPALPVMQETGIAPNVSPSTSKKLLKDSHSLNFAVTADGLNISINPFGLAPDETAIDFLPQSVPTCQTSISQPMPFIAQSNTFEAPTGTSLTVTSCSEIPSQPKNLNQPLLIPGPQTLTPKSMASVSPQTPIQTRVSPQIELQTRVSSQPHIQTKAPLLSAQASTVPLQTTSQTMVTIQSSILPRISSQSQVVANPTTASYLLSVDSAAMSISTPQASGIQQSNSTTLRYPMNFLGRPMQSVAATHVSNNMDSIATSSSMIQNHKSVLQNLNLGNNSNMLPDNSLTLLTSNTQSSAANILAVVAPPSSMCQTAPRLGISDTQNCSIACSNSMQSMAPQHSQPIASNAASRTLMQHDFRPMIRPGSNILRTNLTGSLSASMAPNPMKNVSSMNASPCDIFGTFSQTISDSDAAAPRKDGYASNMGLSSLVSPTDLKISQESFVPNTAPADTPQTVSVTSQASVSNVMSSTSFYPQISNVTSGQAPTGFTVGNSVPQAMRIPAKLSGLSNFQPSSIVHSTLGNEPSNLHAHDKGQHGDIKISSERVNAPVISSSFAPFTSRPMDRPITVPSTLTLESMLANPQANYEDHMQSGRSSCKKDQTRTSPLRSVNSNYSQGIRDFNEVIGTNYQSSGAQDNWENTSIPVKADDKCAVPSKLDVVSNISSVSKLKSLLEGSSHSSPNVSQGTSPYSHNMVYRQPSNRFPDLFNLLPMAPKNSNFSTNQSSLVASGVSNFSRDNFESVISNPQPNKQSYALVGSGTVPSHEFNRQAGNPRSTVRDSSYISQTSCLQRGALAISCSNKGSPSPFNDAHSALEMELKFHGNQSEVFGNSHKVINEQTPRHVPNQKSSSSSSGILTPINTMGSQSFRITHGSSSASPSNPSPLECHPEWASSKRSGVITTLVPGHISNAPTSISDHSLATPNPARDFIFPPVASPYGYGILPQSLSKSNTGVQPPRISPLNTNFGMTPKGMVSQRSVSDLPTSISFGSPSTSGNIAVSNTQLNGVAGLHESGMANTSSSELLPLIQSPVMDRDSHSVDSYSSLSQEQMKPFPVQTPFKSYDSKLSTPVNYIRIIPESPQFSGLIQESPSKLDTRKPRNASPCETQTSPLSLVHHSRSEAMPNENSSYIRSSQSSFSTPFPDSRPIRKRNVHLIPDSQRDSLRMTASNSPLNRSLLSQIEPPPRAQEVKDSQRNPMFVRPGSSTVMSPLSHPMNYQLKSTDKLSRNNIKPTIGFHKPVPMRKTDSSYNFGSSRMNFSSDFDPLQFMRYTNQPSISNNSQGLNSFSSSSYGFQQSVPHDIYSNDLLHTPTMPTKEPRMDRIADGPMSNAVSEESDSPINVVDDSPKAENAKRVLSHQTPDPDGLLQNYQPERPFPSTSQPLQTPVHTQNSPHNYKVKEGFMANANQPAGDFSTQNISHIESGRIDLNPSMEDRSYFEGQENFGKIQKFLTRVQRNSVDQVRPEISTPLATLEEPSFDPFLSGHHALLDSLTSSNLSKTPPHESALPRSLDQVASVNYNAVCTNIIRSSPTKVESTTSYPVSQIISANPSLPSVPILSESPKITSKPRKVHRGKRLSPLMDSRYLSSSASDSESLADDVSLHEEKTNRPNELSSYSSPQTQTIDKAMVCFDDPLESEIDSPNDLHFSCIVGRHSSTSSDGLDERHPDEALSTSVTKEQETESVSQKEGSVVSEYASCESPEIEAHKSSPSSISEPQNVDSQAINVCPAVVNMAAINSVNTPRRTSGDTSGIIDDPSSNSSASSKSMSLQDQHLRTEEEVGKTPKIPVLTKAYMKAFPENMKIGINSHDIVPRKRGRPRKNAPKIIKASNGPRKSSKVKQKKNFIVPPQGEKTEENCKLTNERKSRTTRTGSRKSYAIFFEGLESGAKSVSNPVASPPMKKQRKQTTSSPSVEIQAQSPLLNPQHRDPHVDSTLPSKILTVQEHAQAKIEVKTGDNPLKMTIKVVPSDQSTSSTTSTSEPASQSPLDPQIEHSSTTDPYDPLGIDDHPIVDIHRKGEISQDTICTKPAKGTNKKVRKSLAKKKILPSRSELHEYTPLHRVDYCGPGSTPAGYQLKLVLKKKGTVFPGNDISSTSLVETMESPMPLELLPPSSAQHIPQDKVPPKELSTNVGHKLIIKKSDSNNYSSVIVENPFALKGKEMETQPDNEINDEQIRTLGNGETRKKLVPPKKMVKSFNFREDVGSMLAPSASNLETQKSIVDATAPRNTPLRKLRTDSVEAELAVILGSPIKFGNVGLDKSMNDAELTAILKGDKSERISPVSPLDPNVPLDLSKSSGHVDKKLKTPTKVVLASLSDKVIEKFKVPSPPSDYRFATRTNKKRSLTPESTKRKRHRRATDSIAAEDLENMSVLERINQGVSKRGKRKALKEVGGGRRKKPKLDSVRSDVENHASNPKKNLMKKYISQNMEQHANESIPSAVSLEPIPVSSPNLISPVSVLPIKSVSKPAPRKHKTQNAHLKTVLRVISPRRDPLSPPPPLGDAPLVTVAATEPDASTHSLRLKFKRVQPASNPHAENAGTEQTTKVQEENPRQQKMRNCRAKAMLASDETIQEEIEIGTSGGKAQLETKSNKRRKMRKTSNPKRASKLKINKRSEKRSAKKNAKCNVSTRKDENCPSVPGKASQDDASKGMDESEVRKPSQQEPSFCDESKESSNLTVNIATKRGPNVDEHEAIEKKDNLNLNRTNLQSKSPRQEVSSDVSTIASTPSIGQNINETETSPKMLEIDELKTNLKGLSLKKHQAISPQKMYNKLKAKLKSKANKNFLKMINSGCNKKNMAIQILREAKKRKAQSLEQSSLRCIGTGLCSNLNNNVKQLMDRNENTAEKEKSSKTLDSDQSNLVEGSIACTKLENQLNNGKNLDQSEFVRTTDLEILSELLNQEEIAPTINENKPIILGDEDANGTHNSENKKISTSTNNISNDLILKSKLVGDIAQPVVISCTNDALTSDLPVDVAGEICGKIDGSPKTPRKEMDGDKTDPIIEIQADQGNPVNLREKKPDEEPKSNNLDIGSGMESTEIKVSEPDLVDGQSSTAIAKNKEDLTPDQLSVEKNCEEIPGTFSLRADSKNEDDSSLEGHTNDKRKTDSKTSVEAVPSVTQKCLSRKEICPDYSVEKMKMCGNDKTESKINSTLIETVETDVDLLSENNLMAEGAQNSTSTSTTAPKNACDDEITEKTIPEERRTSTTLLKESDNQANQDKNIHSASSQDPATQSVGCTLAAGPKLITKQESRSPVKKHTNLKEKESSVGKQQSSSRQNKNFKSDAILPKSTRNSPVAKQETKTSKSICFTDSNDSAFGAFDQPLFSCFKSLRPAEKKNHPCIESPRKGKAKLQNCEGELKKFEHASKKCDPKSTIMNGRIRVSLVKPSKTKKIYVHENSSEKSPNKEMSLNQASADVPIIPIKATEGALNVSVNPVVIPFSSKEDPPPKKKLPVRPPTADKSSATESDDRSTSLKPASNDQDTESLKIDVPAGQKSCDNSTNKVLNTCSSDVEDKLHQMNRKLSYVDKSSPKVMKEIESDKNSSCEITPNNNAPTSKDCLSSGSKSSSTHRSSSSRSSYDKSRVTSSSSRSQQRSSSSGKISSSSNTSSRKHASRGSCDYKKSSEHRSSSTKSSEHRSSSTKLSEHRSSSSKSSDSKYHHSKESSSKWRSTHSTSVTTAHSSKKSCKEGSSKNQPADRKSSPTVKLISTEKSSSKSSSCNKSSSTSSLKSSSPVKKANKESIHDKSSEKQHTQSVLRKTSVSNNESVRKPLVHDNRLDKDQILSKTSSSSSKKIPETSKSSYSHSTTSADTDTRAYKSKEKSSSKSRSSGNHSSSNKGKGFSSNRSHSSSARSPSKNRSTSNNKTTDSESKSCVSKSEESSTSKARSSEPFSISKKTEPPSTTSSHLQLFSDDEEEYVPYPSFISKVVARLSPHKLQSMIAMEEEEYCPTPTSSVLFSDETTYIPTKIAKTSEAPATNSAIETYVPVPCKTQSIITSYMPSSDSGNKSDTSSNQSSGSTSSSRSHRKEKSSKGPKKESYHETSSAKAPSATPKNNGTILKYVPKAPTWKELSKSREVSEMPVLKIPFCSDEKDIPPKPIEVGGKSLNLKTNAILDLDEPTGLHHASGVVNFMEKLHPLIPIPRQSSKLLTPLARPPAVSDARTWCKAREFLERSDKKKKTSNKSDEPPKSAVTSHPKGLLKNESTPMISTKLKQFDNFKTTSKKKLPLSPIADQSTSRQAFMKSSQDSLTEKDIHDIFGDASDENFIESSQPSMCLNSLSVKKSDITERKTTEADRSMRRKLRNFTFREQFITEPALHRSFSQNIAGQTIDATFAFKFSDQNLRTAKAIHEYEYLTVMYLECVTSVKENMMPNPTSDEIVALLFLISQDYPLTEGHSSTVKGLIQFGEDGDYWIPGQEQLPTLHVANEFAVLEELCKIVTTWDPDILVGYEVQMSSWGYVLERGAALHMDLASQLSRVPHDTSSHFDDNLDEYGSAHTHQIHLTGRIILNLWRLMRAEVNLQSYTIENVAFHLLHTRIPSYSHQKLFDWWNSPQNRWRTVEFYINRCTLCCKLCEKLDLITRTSELARLFGMQFYEVLSRGTQYRVESMMLRLSRTANMVAFSPGIDQRAAMASPEFLALNMEPLSQFYADPVVVLDFQSLYPSIMIAYNYCFSTCLGRVSLLGTDEPFKFGAGYLKIPPEQLLHMVDHLNISPCGVAFVPETVRKGILPTMLEEILKTRIMVKTAMKLHKNDSSLHRILFSRQLGLKLIANVTYGYTSANFSGRMPCVEVGDSVVSKGRETLERAISLVHSTPKWKARVVYGDTDSIFLHFPGSSKERAFRVGQEIADEVTQRNPKPVKLKFEKVYLPCILQTKKRYVGYMYETADQKEPIFDAKGIETVRRDGCPAMAKVLEKSLRILFDTSDVSLVKQYVQRQLMKLLQGKVSLEDLIFAKEFRGMRGYRPGACVPALELARQWCRLDPRREPRSGERIPYVIVYGAPGLPLIRLVCSPSKLLSDTSLKINNQYYVCKAVLPPLQRCFSLLGVDVFSWYIELPRGSSADLTLENIKVGPSNTIPRFFASITCSSCGNQTQRDPTVSNQSSSIPLCQTCLLNPQKTVLALTENMRSYDRAVQNISKICSSCMGVSMKEVDCISLDCPITYRLGSARDKQQLVPKLRETIENFFGSPYQMNYPD